MDPNTYTAPLQLCSVCDPAKKFLASDFSYLLLFQLHPIQLKLGLQIVGRLLVATYQYQSNYLANQQQVLELAVLFFTNYLSKLCKNVGPKPFC
jgi:hypothetical protein